MNRPQNEQQHSETVQKVTNLFLCVKFAIIRQNLAVILILSILFEVTYGMA